MACLGESSALRRLQGSPIWPPAACRWSAKWPTMAGRYRFMHHAVVVGRGLNYANAFEFALKLMETSYVVAERFSSADFLHGPIAMVEPNFPVFLFTPTGPTWISTRRCWSGWRDLKAETVVITDKSECTRCSSLGAARDHDSREDSGDPLADSLHRARSVVRGGARTREEYGSGPAPDIEQGDANVVKPRSRPCNLTGSATSWRERP